MHVGAWGLAIIVTVVVSWLMYRYLALDNWKEWTRVGVLQAFIIAFYAYTLLARKEERQMLAQFGDDYRTYQRRVPMFFPRISSTQQQES